MSWVVRRVALFYRAVASILAVRPGSVADALAQVVLLGTATLILYTGVLALISYLPGTDIRSPLSIGWTGAFALATVFATWNFWDSLLDVRAAYRRGAPARTIAGGFWRLRSDALQGACCVAMAGAGTLAIIQWSTMEVRTAILLSAGVFIVTNQVWNRVDRERLWRMPSPTADRQAMRWLATQIAADARVGFHSVGNTLQVPIGVLELLRIRPGLTTEEVIAISEAIAALLDLADEVEALHDNVRLLDPSIHRNPEKTSTEGTP